MRKKSQKQPKEQSSPEEAPKAKTKKKKRKIVYVADDGHTVYDMSNVGRGREKKDDDVGLSRKERKAAIFAAFAFYLPRLLLVLGCFTAVGVLLYLWLT